MIMLIILQTEIPLLWSDLAEKGLLILILGIAVYVLWKRDSVMNDKMNKYLDEDRKEMLTVINNNTEAFEQFTKTIDRIISK